MAKINIKHRNGMFRFETRCQSTYDVRFWRLLVSEWMPDCNGEMLLRLIGEEEVRVQKKIEEVNKLWLEQNSLPIQLTVSDMQEFINKRVVLSKRGKKLVIKYNDVASAKYSVETLLDARTAVAGITTVFRAPECPVTTSALIPHLLRQRVFELLHEAKMLSAIRLFDNVVIGRGVIA